MPRYGQNPLRWVDRLASPAPVSLATMVHVPDLYGYWRDALEVLHLCLDSLLATTPADAELLVLDNGSCPEIRRELRRRFDEGSIHQLFESKRNLGKVGGWNLLFAAADGGTVAYFDSDVYFLPGWLESSLEVLRAFPEAAMVTAQPIPGDLSLHCDATLEQAAADTTVDIEEGDHLIPEHYVESHRRGLGESRLAYAPRIAGRRDVRLRRGEVEAYVSASHFQFLTRKEVLEEFFPLPTSIPLGDDRELDRRLDEAGCWRLSTVDYRVHHLGNKVPDLATELPWHEPADPAPRPQMRGSRMGSGIWRQLLARAPIRRLLKRIHRTTYSWLYSDRPSAE